MSTEPSVYDLFITEMDALTIPLDMPAVAVVGELTRAVKRAQNKHDAANGEYVGPAFICACGHDAWTSHGGILPSDEPGCDECDCTRNEYQAEDSALRSTTPTTDPNGESR